MHSQRIAKELRNLATALANLAEVLDEETHALPLPKKPAKKRERRHPQGLERFADFWQLYPRKVAKVKAQQAWMRNGCDQQADTIIACMANHPSFLTSDVCFIPHPATWLNQHRWQDTTEVRRVETIDLGKMIEKLEQKQARELEEEHAYLRETGFLPSHGSA